MDGTGGSSPVIDAISLEANKKYDVSVRFLNESVSPVEDITTEVAEESDEQLAERPCIAAMSRIPEYFERAAT